MINMIDLKKFVNSLLSYFPKDCYICNNKFIVSGELSDKETTGRFILFLNSDVYELLESNKLNQMNIYYINDIRKHKDDFFESLEIVKRKDNLNYVMDNMKRCTETVCSSENWNEFKFDENELDILFEKRLSIYMKKDDNDKYLILSKSMIPGFTKSNYNEYLYTFIDQPDAGLDSIVITYHGIFFDSYMIYYIIKV